MSTSETKAADTLARKRIRVIVGKDNLSAKVVVNTPEPHEPAVSVEEVTGALNAAGVAYGIQPDAISAAIADHQYEVPVDVAKGDPPQKGKDTVFEYLFEAANRFRPQEGEDGRIDYRDMKYIVNAEEGQVLVRRTLPTEGVNGKGVNGATIAAPRGRNLPFLAGEGTRVSEDESELIATTEGAVVVASGVVSVKNVMVIRGDVDFSVGNIDAAGSVRVTGKVQAGFKLHVKGNLEVNGNVEDSEIRVGGNVLIKGGFFGSGEGELQADGDVTVKHAQGQKITAGGSVYVGGELVNCQIEARERVLVNGRKGKIVGGQVRAGKEIRAASIGSDAGTATVVGVAFDSDLMQKYHDTRKELERLAADHKRVKESLTSLYRLQMDGKLTGQQEGALTKLENFMKELPDALESLKGRKTEIEEKMKEARDARIVAVGSIYPGVKAQVGILTLEVEEEHKSVELTGDGFKVQMHKYDGRDHS